MLPSWPEFLFFRCVDEPSRASAFDSNSAALTNLPVLFIGADEAVEKEETSPLVIISAAQNPNITFGLIAVELCCISSAGPAVMGGIGGIGSDFFFRIVILLPLFGGWDRFL